MYENNFRIRFRFVQFNNFRRQKNTLWEADEIDGSQYREKNVTNQETWRNLLKPVDSHWHWKTWHVWQSIHAWNRNILFFSKINFWKKTSFDYYWRFHLFPLLERNSQNFILLHNKESWNKFFISLFTNIIHSFSP